MTVLNYVHIMIGSRLGSIGRRIQFIDVINIFVSLICKTNTFQVAEIASVHFVLTTF